MCGFRKENAQPPRGAANFITYIFYQNTAAIETVKAGKRAFLTNLNPLPLIVLVK